MFGLTFRKEFGQNFLTDREVVAEIAESCGGPNTKTVLEIGAGCGSLTHELALRYENVVALEIDRGLIPLLKYTLGEHRNIKVINADVMKVANEKAMVLHCLPAHREEEITAEVFEAHAKEIFDEAENRLHAQKAVLVKCLGGDKAAE